MKKFGNRSIIYLITNLGILLIFFSLFTTFAVFRLQQLHLAFDPNENTLQYVRAGVRVFFDSFNSAPIYFSFLPSFVGILVFQKVISDAKLHVYFQVIFSIIANGLSVILYFFLWHIAVSRMASPFFSFWFEKFPATIIQQIESELLWYSQFPGVTTDGMNFVLSYMFTGGFLYGLLLCIDHYENRKKIPQTDQA